MFSVVTDSSGVNKTFGKADVKRIDCFWYWTVKRNPKVRIRKHRCNITRKFAGKNRGQVVLSCSTSIPICTLRLSRSTFYLGPCMIGSSQPGSRSHSPKAGETLPAVSAQTCRCWGCQVWSRLLFGNAQSPRPKKHH